jgi:CHASE2 domain-containing sensor protein/tRNA A-37 threonylcarbamoyl transferase component Bud32
MGRKTSNSDLLLGAIIIFVFIGLSFVRPSLFEAFERCVYDIQMRLVQGEDQAVPMVGLIHIDDKSLASLGSWPWPRHLIAQMIDLLKKSGAKVVGINIPFVEKESNPALGVIESFREKLSAYPFGEKDPTLTTWISENLKQMEREFDTDERLVESVQQSGFVVLPFSFHSGDSNNGFENEQDALLSDDFLESGRISASAKKMLSTSNISLPFSDLARNALGLGHDKLTVEGSFTGLFHPMFLVYKGAVLPSFPLRLSMGYLDLQPKEVLLREHQIQLGSQIIPLNRGKLLIKFRNAPGLFPQYSFVDILQRKQVPSILKGRIVLIGFNSRESAKIDTPILPGMGANEFIANILDNIISNAFMTRPSFMIHIEALIAFLLGGIASYVLPRMRSINRFGIAMGLIILTLSAGWFLFFQFNVWLKTTYAVNCILILYLAVSLKQLIAFKRARGDSVATNRLLGLDFQSQGLLDQAFDKFRRLPVDNEVKDLIYALGLEYERKRMIEKALTTYEYIEKWGPYRDLDERIPRLSSDGTSTNDSYGNDSGVSMIADHGVERRSTIGRYQIIEELGEGSMGKVYKALDPKINRMLAVKTIRLSNEFEEDVVQEIKKRFSREAEIAGKLSHPAIGTIYDVGEEGELTYMAMEFVEGVNIEQHTAKDNLLPFRKTLKVVADVAEALDFAHKAGVIHRDIKPANIMLLENGEVKVTDFGIAKAISSSRTKTGVILGTPNYMSPEQIMGQKIDQQSDIFSLGILFFQLLTGELPFKGDNLSGLLYQITQMKHLSVQTYDPKIPKICDQILDKALAKKPSDRFKSAAEMERVIRLLASRIDSFKKKRADKGEHPNGSA